MFVGWIRQKSFLQDIKKLQEETFLDENLLINTQKHFPYLCYGVYDDTNLVCVIAAYEFENFTIINNFSYIKDLEDKYKQRVVSLLLQNIRKEDSTILLMSNKNENTIFKDLGFEKYTSFSKATYQGGAHFNFTNATAKSISNPNFIPTINKLNKKVLYSTDFTEYITQNIMKTSSLLLSTDFGYQHSYAIDKSIIRVSPFFVDSEAFNDAEKLLRGVIYHRGLKKIITFIPSDVKEITKLYENYNFSFENNYELLYKGNKISIDIESIYGL